MNNEDIKTLAEFISGTVINKQNQYESITKKAFELFYKKQTAKFIEFYNNEVTSITGRIEALGTFLMAVLEKENWDLKKVLKFRESISKSENNDFIYLFDNAMFQAGANSPEEFIQSIEDGIKKQVPLAYAIKSLFYKYGLELFESSKQAIEKAILLEPNNLKFKKMLKELEIEKAMNDEQDL